MHTLKRKTLIPFGLAIITIILLLGGLSLMPAASQARPLTQTNVAGDITSDTTWTVAGSPYILNGDITVQTGVTLTVEPGVVVQGDTFDELSVEGHLEAVGTETNPILFTSVVDSGPGEWVGLQFSTGTGHLQHVTVRYGGRSVFSGDVVRGNIYVHNIPDGGEVLIEDSAIESSAANTFAMVINTNEVSQVRLVNNSFNSNGLNQILLNGNAISNDARLVSQTGLGGYTLSDDLTVQTGVTLTIDPGVTVRGDLFEELSVEGHLEAVGTETNPILFTSVVDSGPGEWVGLQFSTGTGHLQHVTVRYGGRSVFSGDVVRGNIYVQNVPDGGEVLIEDSAIESSAADTFAMVINTNEVSQVRLVNNNFSSNGLNQILLNGNSISSNAQLVSQTGLQGYALSDDLTVQSGVTLTVDPGVTVRGSDFEELTIRGHLQAVGTAANPIIFTSDNDSGEGQWVGLQISTGSGHLKHVVIRYGGNSFFTGSNFVRANLNIQNSSGSVLIEQSQIIDSENDGLYITDSRVQLTCVTVTDNGDNGITFDSDGMPIFSSFLSSVTLNNGAGMINENISPVDVRGIWWGHPSGPSGEGPGSGDQVGENLFFDPWLTAEPDPNCVIRQVYLPLVIK